MPWRLRTATNGLGRHPAAPQPQEEGKAMTSGYWTVVLLEGRTPKRAIGQFDTKAEAEAWAKHDGWSDWIVIPFHP